MKYNIDKELKRLAWFKPPLNKPAAYISHLLMRLLPKGIDKAKSIYEIEYYDNIKHHVFKPNNCNNTLIYYIHAGGFTYSMSPSHYKMLVKYAYNTSCNVIAIDYSLLPRYKYPTQINEVVESLKSLHSSYDKIILMADSAGASIALDSYLLLQNEGINIRDMILIYPVVSSESNTNSMKEFTNSPLWNSRLNSKMWKWYIGDNQYQDFFTKADSLKLDNLYIEVCEVDCLRDEGMNLYNVISSTNKILHINRNAYHGFETLYNTSHTKSAINRRINYVNSLLKQEA